MTLLDVPVGGMTWGWVGIRGTWNTPEGRRSLDELGRLGGNWIGVTFAALQDTAQSTTIPFEDEPTLTDDEVRWAIREGKSRGWKVCLKPVVNCADGTWRGWIGFFDWDVPGEPNWTQWFASYTRFMLHYARIAEEEGVELLCIGCEMVRSDSQDAKWRALITEIRAVYSGPITYNCDKYQEDRVTWWDAVDIVSSSGYYPIGEWDTQLDRIEKVVKGSGKPFFFMETGCPSREGSGARPNDWTLRGSVSGTEQERFYRDMFEACARRDWVRGFMLWDWLATLYSREDAAQNNDYCIYGKPAETVVRAEFGGYSPR